MPFRKRFYGLMSAASCCDRPQPTERTVQTDGWKEKYRGEKINIRKKNRGRIFLLITPEFGIKWEESASENDFSHNCG